MSARQFLAEIRREWRELLEAVVAVVAFWTCVAAIMAIVLTVDTWGEIVDAKVEQWEQDDRFARDAADRHAEVFQRVRR